MSRGALGAAALASLGLISLLGAACAPRNSAYFPILRSPPRRANLPLLSVLTPAADPVVPLIEALRSEVSGDFDINVVTLDLVSTTEELKTHLDQNPPSLVVLVDNSAVELYAPLARASKVPLPSVIVMASFVEQVVAQVPNSMAIAYETPAVTIFSDMRNLFRRRVNRVGVLYRAGFEQFIALEMQRAQPEQIELVAIPLPVHPNLVDLTRALRRLEKERVEAVWITNDNALLSSSFLLRAWVPFSKKVNAPVVVGVPSLLEQPLDLGTFAAVPDTTGLGVQTADFIYSLREVDFKLLEPRVQPSISTRTFLNVPRARELGFPREHEARVDVLLTPPR